MTEEDIREVYAAMKGDSVLLKSSLMIRGGMAHPSLANMKRKHTPFGICPVVGYSGNGWVLVEVTMQQLVDFLYEYGDDGDLEFDGVMK